MPVEGMTKMTWNFPHQAVKGSIVLTMLTMRQVKPVSRHSYDDVKLPSTALAEEHALCHGLAAGLKR